MTKIIRNNHITFTSASDMSEICKPLNKLGITSFNFVRTFDDGAQINLSNTPHWLEHFYNNEFYKIGAFEKHPSNYDDGYSLWPNLSGQRIFCDARMHFNIDHGITIVEKQINSCDFFYFGTSSNNPGIINLYLNNLDLLKRFILYFRDNSHKLIKTATNDKIILPDHFVEEKTAVNDLCEFSALRNEFLKEIPIKKLMLNGSLQGQVLTQKQLECLVPLLEGKTAKEVAKQIGISFRTVEDHINKLKTKFGCETKVELLNTLKNNGLGVLLNKAMSSVHESY